jgi:hypothetical protein
MTGRLEQMADTAGITDVDVSRGPVLSPVGMAMMRQ